MEHKALQLLKIPETRKKLLNTLGLLLAFRIGFQIPIPGMSPQFLYEQAAGMRGSLFGIMNAFSGGAFGQTAIFGLGIMPYISASIIFSMLAKVSPRIEAVAKEGPAGSEEDQPVDAPGNCADRADSVAPSSTPASFCRRRR